jgi:uncharacterized membrane protein (DUF485 family)
MELPRFVFVVFLSLCIMYVAFLLLPALKQSWLSTMRVLCLVAAKQCYFSLPFAFWLGRAPHLRFGSPLNQC